MTLAFDFPTTVDSCFARMDPRWKLAAIVPTVILLALVRTMPAALAGIVAALGLAGLARLPWKWLTRRLAWTAFLLALFLVWLPFLPDPRGEALDWGWASFSMRGFTHAVMVLCKTLAMVTLMFVLLATAPL